MWPASARWREHVLMYAMRDTRGCALNATDSINHFPATPYICLTWMLDGELHLQRQGDKECDQRLPKICLIGCQSRHGVTMNVGDRNSFMAVFFSDAFHALFDLDLSALQDSFVDARLSLNDEGKQLIEAVAKAEQHEQRVQLIEQFLAQHAAALALSPWPRLRRISSNLSLRIASALLGVGERQAQRRARREACMSLLSLSRLWRAKRSHSAVQLKLAQGEALNWAQHANDQAYADQSHMVKECKELTGKSPQQLVDTVKKNENYWMYRL
jgi:AraC-like DNA-binding protein